MHIILDNLHPETLEDIYENINRGAHFEAKTHALSCLDGDILAGCDKTLAAFIPEYFTLQRHSLSAHANMLEQPDLTALQRLDLSYRYGTTDISSAYFLENLTELLPYRRAFLIAYAYRLQDIMDIFLEYHPTSWFDFCADLIRSPDDKRDITVSSEKSAKKIGDAYFIHSGTNNWNKGWLQNVRWGPFWSQNIRNWGSLIRKSSQFCSENSIKDCLFLIVPERDTLARMESNRFPNSASLPLLYITTLLQEVVAERILFPVVPLLNHSENPTRYSLPDSHLSAEDYWIIFQEILKHFPNYTLPPAVPEFSIVEGEGDLGIKFGQVQNKRQHIHFPSLETETEVIAGSAQFIAPLSKNHVCISNPNAPIDKKVLLCGDSHSSIGGNPFLTHIFSIFFTEVEFFWNPYLLHPLSRDDLSDRTPDLAIFEIAQRFISPNLEHR